MQHKLAWDSTRVRITENNALGNHTAVGLAGEHLPGGTDEDDKPVKWRHRGKRDQPRCELDTSRISFYSVTSCGTLLGYHGPNIHDSRSSCQW